MNDSVCVALLQWALPRMGLRWEGFRKVRARVCKRIARRIRALGLDDVDAYRRYLVAHAEEWAALDALCRVTISRFLRDRGVQAFLGATVLPELARRCADRGAGVLRCWSAGCASGEEPYSVVLLWRHSEILPPHKPALEILATDSDAAVLERAAQACYGGSSLKEVPARWREQAFHPCNGLWCLRGDYRSPVQFLRQDLRREAPEGLFDLILCRNLAFTYYGERIQAEVLQRLCQALVPGGALVIGVHEHLPTLWSELDVWSGRCRVYRKRGLLQSGGFPGLDYI